MRNLGDDMDLLTPEIREKLIANAHEDDAEGLVPVVKFFNPVGAATWLITQMLDDDTVYGAADLGMDCIEYGTVSISELESLKLALGLGIERDIHFVGRYPLTLYVDAGERANNSLMAGIQILHSVPRV